ncbi:hypothetical protein HMPREF1051_0732 [Neisseria sicca VK64]|uniref:Uncharacterized protein n=1 Tax=Neisseria sicca VK64 TaxID=1095748 RepID=I2NQG7_NEISI|nr:hypothetical protein HMPREF1051_0732 [Neisseria sicca VK64]
MTLRRKTESSLLDYVLKRIKGRLKTVFRRPFAIIGLHRPVRFGTL